MLARIVEGVRRLLRELGVRVRERDLMPERRDVIVIDASRIEFRTPDGAREEMAVDALERVEATTTRAGATSRSSSTTEHRREGRVRQRTRPR